MTRRVAILLFDDFDLIDAGGPYEVFLTASRLAERDGLPPQYEVLLVSPSGADAVAFGGMTLTGLQEASAVGRVDIAIVPGTIDVARAVADSALAAAVEALLGASEVTASVCTGAFLLAEAGALVGKSATTHWEDVPQLAQAGGVREARTGVRWVDEGAIVTSGGLTSGIHMALHLVARDHGVEHAVRTARQLDLPWDPAGVS
ncbi:DJ-1/PfpI family protein [Demequina sp. TTPB684]|uniref:DJ-1/PfpI family protein n=1 Tax=unclassified Demequina TaxID=2620311 RepID=UPI001CF3F43B|nr:MULTISPECIES: DJ-1/PfpI family protein [unclassified Demequina]MCB2412624.1 DJ-1/PfpI family protein [Demequina sp. TTPB684]UPU88231.1 DJ-1/PfpI family protein [Demequina sp. TMPB413]